MYIVWCSPCKAGKPFCTLLNFKKFHQFFCFFFIFVLFFLFLLLFCFVLEMEVIIMVWTINFTIYFKLFMQEIAIYFDWFVHCSIVLLCLRFARLFSKKVPNYNDDIVIIWNIHCYNLFIFPKCNVLLRKKMKYGAIFDNLNSLTSFDLYTHFMFVNLLLF